MDCLFCDIASGQVPSQVVYETEHVYAFADISPVAPVHVLVIPREHIGNASDLRLEHGSLLAEMFEAASKIAAEAGVNESGYRLVFNVGDDAGNQVPHLHLHVIGGRQLEWPPG